MAKAGEYRGTGVWDVQSKAEVVKPLALNWGMAEWEQMSAELQAMWRRFRATQLAVLGYIDGR